MKTLGKKIGLYWAPAILCMLGIFLLSNTTSSTLGQVKEGSGILPFYLGDFLTSQYFVHPVEFGALAVLIYRLLVSYQNLSVRVAVFGATAWTFTYAILDEFHQSFVAGRNSAMSDVGLDTGGALAALVIVMLVRPYMPTFFPR